MGAGQRRIFDDRHLGVGRTLSDIAKGAWDREIGRRHVLGESRQARHHKGRSSGGSEKLKRLAPGDHR